MWRTPREMAARSSAPGRTARFPIREPEFFAFKRHCFEIENAIVRHRCFEAIRMSDQPINGIAAVACARNSQALCVNKWEIPNGIKDCGEVTHHLAAPVL